MRRKFGVTIWVAIAAALPIAAPAAATMAPQSASITTTSSNWAGYVVRRRGVRFSRVIGTWRVPAVSCSPGHKTFSASWVGLGGFAASSHALEQTGTDSDCSASGRAVYSAWFEVVPAAAHDFRMKVHPGDRITASATVKGHDVLLRLVNRTRGRSVERRLQASKVDVSSADWIIEAPGVCSGTSLTDAGCRQSNLANFGATTFAGARATSAGGRAGTISGGHWAPTLVSLVPDSRFAGAATLGSAVPGSLSSTGTTFNVAYGTVAGGAGPGAGAPSPVPSAFRSMPG
jgi:hypothetical protein